VELKGEDIEIAGARAYLSLPQSSGGPLPAVLVIHEWWGLNDNRAPRAAHRENLPILAV